MNWARGFLAVMAILGGANESVSGESWDKAAQDYALGPVPPNCDLRSMLRTHIVRQSCQALSDAAKTREGAIASGQWKPWRDALREKVRADLGEIRFGSDGPPLNVRPISRHEREHYVIENVLFESLPGWDVNGSVYLPLAADFPPPWPAVIIPVGHSCKQRESYQIPAQVFARSGYVAITFDPPGMAGEKQGGNDHFTDGVRCYLTGHSSNRYFVADAIRCVDYLASRPDVDMGNGVGMTGVSGGGFTTMFAALLDARVRVAGPSCCTLPNAFHPVLDAYAPCAETLAAGRFMTYDDVDILAALAPTPTLLMAGAEDEVFKIEWGHEIASAARRSYDKAEAGDRFDFFVDPGGHAYTVAMALEFTTWLDRWIRKTPGRSLPKLSRDDLEMLSMDQLRCNPRKNGGMLAMNRALAQALREKRSGLSMSEAVGDVAHIAGEMAVPTARIGEPFLVWFHHLREMMIDAEPGIELPATYLTPAKEGWKGGAILYFNDRGRWTDLRHTGMLARATDFLNAETGGPAVLTVDLRGWGDTAPADLPYEIASWGSSDRWISYVSAALGDHVLAMRIRDGLSALRYLRSREEIDPKRIIVGGRGMGGVVALHLAALEPTLAGVFSIEQLCSFECLATSDSYTWGQDAFLPDVLKHYDLPELTAALTMPTLLIDPQGPTRAPLKDEEARAMYTSALDRETGFQLHAGVGQGRATALVKEMAQGLAAP
jgi:dienelactone hydrolase